MSNWFIARGSKCVWESKAEMRTLILELCFAPRRIGLRAAKQCCETLRTRNLKLREREGTAVWVFDFFWSSLVWGFLVWPFLWDFSTRPLVEFGTNWDGLATAKTRVSVLSVKVLFCKHVWCIDTVNCDVIKLPFLDKISAAMAPSSSNSYDRLEGFITLSNVLRENDNVTDKKTQLRHPRRERLVKV
ncbi:hypothetical protein OSB04_028268 [Centaurea solstitialis]|uniref:Uncharacterized protein n=1 Tax=Centaurea solstitialis TaxID=347529 RepID=A0AA38VXJ0_9ASTR|nr:hypothetical protein OSB04_028268 [Centaurea solstitialis]